MLHDLVPIVAITFGVSFIPAIIWIILSYRKRRRFMELHHAERMAAIERGMDIPALPIELIDGRSRGRRSSLQSGLIWSFIGLALLISMWLDGDFPALPGLVCLGIGLAHLIYYGMEGRKVEARQLDYEMPERGSAIVAAERRDVQV
jgi:hypothetical protein